MPNPPRSSCPAARRPCGGSPRATTRSANPADAGTCRGPHELTASASEFVGHRAGLGRSRPGYQVGVIGREKPALRAAGRGTAATDVPGDLGYPAELALSL